MKPDENVPRGSSRLDVEAEALQELVNHWSDHWTLRSVPLSATRRRQLTNKEIYQGYSMTITAESLRELERLLKLEDLP